MAKQAEIKHLLTSAGEKLCGGEWDVYPRPCLVRDSFYSLNGDWELTATDGRVETVKVPYPPESVISGVGRSMGKRPHLFYRRSFSLPAGFIKDRVILHFGAIDQIATVTLNGRYIGEHIGGYGHFSYDVTDALQEENELCVEVVDELYSKILPYGKQREDRGGMWYTPVSGIWQTVWIESVPEKYVRRLDITTTESSAVIEAEGVTEGSVTVTIPGGDITVPLSEGRAEIVLDDPIAWSPENPHLYEFKITAGNDTVSSYFALRTLKIGEVDGVSRILLNGKPYFFHGVLDQGYFSDGIFTPATPEEYERDILTMKALGFNTLRKHIKLEPELFYYYCDKLGMIVFQDMINNSDYSFIRDTALPTIGVKRINDKHLHKNPKSRKAFEDCMREIVDTLRNHPSVCYYTVFNEGWGQFESEKMYRLIKSLDGTRIIDTASGWFFGAESDVESIHVYFKPVKIKPSKKPIILSEFGGYSYKPEGHVANDERTYAYAFYDDRKRLEDAFVKLYEDEVIPQIKTGLCGAIYTQLSDVEDETNGIISYDRKVVKMNAERLCAVAEKLKI